MKLDKVLLRCTFDCLVADGKAESVVLVDVGELPPERRDPAVYLENARIEALLQIGSVSGRLFRVEQMYRPHL